MWSLKGAGHKGRGFSPGAGFVADPHPEGVLEDCFDVRVSYRERMPQSLHQVYGHLVFSTKNREALIDPEIESRLYEYMGGIVRDLGGSTVEIKGMPDHIHLLIRASKSVSDVEFMKQLKGSSSVWMGEQGVAGFKWQAGYGWFGVSALDVEKAGAYVRGQKEHHRTVGFQEEFRRFLERYGVEYDERYVWD